MTDMKSNGNSMYLNCTAAFDKYNIAVILPCYNEEEAIGKVVGEFNTALPSATIYVYDNNSTDQTRRFAREAGALVYSEKHQGKGNVVRRMFADIEADIYVLADGDGTYHAGSATTLVRTLVEEQLDMVVGSRLSNYDETAFRLGHKFGNNALSGFVGVIFGSSVTDMLSGFRVFSRRFVKSFPALASGFEIETELTVHALELRMPVSELPTPYSARPFGSESKLRTYRDGLRILLTIVNLYKAERPLSFFSIIFALLASFSLWLGYPVVLEYLATGLVPRFPTAILATGIMLLAFLSLTSGFVLDTVTYGRRELKRLTYLSIPGLAARELHAQATVTE
jgi:glycosyltransferase involved in cell wall biosynthesis